MKLASIQFLRALAVILLLYTYSIDLTMSYGYIEAANHYFWKIGLIGQDLFFIISGFIIAHTSLNYNGFEESALFFQKRFVRINPLYYISSLAFLGCHVLYGWYSFQMIPMPTQMMLTSFADTLLIVPTSNNLTDFKPLLKDGWVLSFGWLFYTFVCIAIAGKVKYKFQILCLTILILSIVGYTIKPTDLRIMFITNPIMLEFLLGLLIYKAYIHFPQVPTFISMSLVLISLSFVSFILIYGYGYISTSSTILNGSLSMNRVLLWGFPSAGIVASCLFLERDKKLNPLWNNALLYRIGNASYSIFLIHGASFALLGLVYRKLQLDIPAYISITIQLILTILIGILFYIKVERPLLKWLNKFILRPSKIDKTVNETQPSI